MSITNLSQMQAATLSMLTNVVAAKADKQDVDSFCKIANVVISTLRTHMDYIKSTRQFQRIEFIEDTKLIEGKK